MSHFRKKPVVIEAWLIRELCHQAEWDWWALPQAVRDLYDGKNRIEGVTGGVVFTNDGVHIPTLEGAMFGAKTDWLIKGIKGEFYPCKPDIFEATYEPVEETP
jgi:hypothetical protein